MKTIFGGLLLAFVALFASASAARAAPDPDAYALYGMVNCPGRHPLPYQPLSLRDALDLAGGALLVRCPEDPKMLSSIFASLKSVKVIRTVKGVTTTLVVDARKGAQEALSFVVEPGDLIIVPEWWWNL